MSRKNHLKRIISLVLIVVLMSVDISASAALITFETQYDYEDANLAWLTDLVIKEDMTTAEGMAQRVELVPKPEYPYTETPDSFAKDVNYFISLYNLSEGSQRASYIYFFDILNANSELVDGNVSDEDIKEYLEGIGIVYPSEVDSDELIIARALFTALVTGSVSGNSYSSGVSLEEVLVSYMAGFIGMNIQTLEEWIPDGSTLSIDEYILAASRFTLWSNGYDVSVDTPEDEVYRLIAVMTVKAQGLSIDSDLPFDELNLKYIATLLSEKYSVSVDSEKLGVAIENDNAAFYILQLIGKDNGLAVREDNISYEDAFYLVAENSDVFDVEKGEFYADIYEYDVYLVRRCSSIWIYPTAYSTSRDTCTVVVTVNGTAINNNYYNQIKISAESQEQDLRITVSAVEKGETYYCTYVVHLHQGTYEGVQGDNPVTGNNGQNVSTSDSIVVNILASLGVNIDISEILNSTFLTVPVDVTDMISYIAPTFGDSSNVSQGSATTEEFYLNVLDELGALADFDLTGISGIDVLNNYANGDDSMVIFG